MKGILSQRNHPTVRKIWGDAAYQGIELKAFTLEYGAELEVVKRPPGRKRIYNDRWIAEWVPVARTFSVLPRRWVVERTFAWLGRNRRLNRDYEYMPDVSESYIYVGMGRLMLRRWAKNYA